MTVIATLHRDKTRLSARASGLQAVPADVAALAASLRALDLSANELQALALPPALPVLEELLLADNLLDAPTMQRLQPALPATLRILDLTANRMVAFPPALLKLPQLMVLRVARQQLRALPAALSALASLEELDASYNSLGSALQLAPPGLPRLRQLLLNGNCLSSLELDPDRVPRLRELEAADNKITAWPEAVGGLTELHTLHLGNNGLRGLAGHVRGGWKRPCTLPAAPSARLVRPGARSGRSPLLLRARREQLGSLRWPQQPASGRSKVEESSPRVILAQ